MVTFAPPPKVDYDASADRIEALPADLTRERTRRSISIADAAVQIGIGKDTLTRLESGLTKDPTKTTIVAALRWLGKLI